MKVVFLDIDGVMNSRVFYENKYKRNKRTIKYLFYILRRVLIHLKIKKPITSENYKIPNNFYSFEYQFERLKEETCLTKWKWLSEWCNENNVKICISSVWRNHFGVEGKR